MRVLLFAVFSFGAFASFLQGSWKGSGELIVRSMGYDDVTTCPTVEFEIEHTAKLVELNKGNFKCEDKVSKSYDPFEAQIRDTKLVYGGDTIGKVSPASLEADFEDFFSGTIYEIKASLNADGLLTIYQSEESFFGSKVITEAKLERISETK